MKGVEGSGGGENSGGGWWQDVKWPPTEDLAEAIRGDTRYIRPRYMCLYAFPWHRRQACPHILYVFPRIFQVYHLLRRLAASPEGNTIQGYHRHQAGL